MKLKTAKVTAVEPIDRVRKHVAAVVAGEHGAAARLCREAKVPRSTLSHWLGGSRGISASALCRVMDATGLLPKPVSPGEGLKILAAEMRKLRL